MIFWSVNIIKLIRQNLEFLEKKLVFFSENSLESFSCLGLRFFLKCPKKRPIQMRAFHSNENDLFCTHPLPSLLHFFFGGREEASRKLSFE